MKELSICPATLAPGFTTYSPVAAKALFEGKQISPYLDFSFEDDENKQEIVQNVGRVSVSGVQEKFSGVLDGNLNDKMKRNYRRIIEERHQRFIRESE